MENSNEKIIGIITEEFGIEKWQAENTIELIDDGNTIPFIARYRKEKTGTLSDEVLRDFSERLTYLRSLEEKKADIQRLIDEQGKLTDELKAAISNASTLSELEDIYRPYRPKRRTRATIAKEKGLEPLAIILFKQELKDGSVDSIALDFIDTEKGVETTEDALDGAMDIIAEAISDNADYRKVIRATTMRDAILRSKAATEEDSVYSLYYDFAEPLSKLANHRLLAVNRGHKVGLGLGDIGKRPAVDAADQ